jgi:hypothetical protein
MTTLAVFRTEIIKSKNTLALWLVMLGAAFIPFLFFLIYINRWERFVPKPGVNPWTEFIDSNFRTGSFLLIPFFIVLLCSLVVTIEHKSNAWKHLLTLPVTKGTIYLNKLLLIIGLTLLCYCFFLVFMLLSAMLLGTLQSKLGFLSQAPEWTQLAKLTIKSFISTLGILAIHYWLSLRFKNLFVSIGIGLLCIITSTILLGRWEHVVFVPYTYTALTAVSPAAAPKWNVGPYFLTYHELFSLAYFGLVSLGSYLDFTRFYRG